jgi:hypothetical protein
LVLESWFLAPNTTRQSMMILNPIWLFALAAISIPVVIHLWNIRNGKVLKVGSISLITAASRKSSRSLNLLDLLLLLLRCLLLIAIAFLLATPLWKQSNVNGKVKGWILLPKENLHEGYAKFKVSIDSLTSKGYEFHYFNKGFAKTDLKQELAAKKNGFADSLNGKPVSYNALLSQLQEKVAGNIPLAVFTPNRFSRFADEQVPVALNIKWKTYTPADSTHTWLQSAWFTANKDIVIVQGTGKPNGTNYQRFTFKPSDNGNTNPFEVKINGGRATVNLKNDVQHTIVVDTSLYSVAVYNDGYSADAHYLTAALEADLAFIPHHAVIKNYTSAEAIPAGQEWIFWLSEKPLPSAVKQLAKRIFGYAAGSGKVVDSWISTEPGLYNSPEPKVPLFKMISMAKSSEQAVWKDGFGNPVLGLDKHENASVYSFYSRLNPSWNNLVWSDEFPEIMLKLLTSDEKAPEAANDRRVINLKQLPITSGVGGNHNLAAATLKSFGNYIWVLLITLFFMERWLAHHKKTIQLN